MTCLSRSIEASLPLWSIAPWLIRDSADSSRGKATTPSASSLVNYCCFAPNTHDRQSQVVHRTRQLFCVRRNCVAKTNSSSHSVALADGYRRPGHISPFSTKSSWYQISTIKLFNLPIYLHIACLFEQFTAQRSNKSQSTIVTRSHATFTVCCVAVWLKSGRMFYVLLYVCQYQLYFLQFTKTYLFAVMCWHVARFRSVRIVVTPISLEVHSTLSAARTCARVLWRMLAEIS